VPDESARRGNGSAVAARPRTASRITVRRATERDLPALVALRLGLLAEEVRNPFFANPHPDAERRAMRLTRAELGTKGQVMFVACIDREIVGILRCRAVRRTPLVSDSRHAIVTTVYVIPSRRRTGVLRALLGAADRWCRQHRLTAMRLQCALTNDAGRKSWEALGFNAAELLYLRTVPSP
jgi:GNAT superfamily N-acetyltransferase